MMPPMPELESVYHLHVNLTETGPFRVHLERGDEAWHGDDGETIDLPQELIERCGELQRDPELAKARSPRPEPGNVVERVRQCSPRDIGAWLWTVLPVPLVLLWATWLRAPDWVRENASWPARLRAAAAVVVPAAIC